MIKVRLKGTNSYEAAEWCNDNLEFEQWTLWMETWATYVFEFKNPKDATVFALKWLSV
jgi:hypothetical protein